MKDILQYIHPFKIGNIEIKNNVLLAPMAGVTDLPFRYIAHKYGNVAYAVTEMVSAKGLVYQDKKTHKIMDMYDKESPKVVQIFGSEKDVLKQVVQGFNENPDIDIIDFNLGCPAHKVVKNGDGSELLKDLDKVEELIKEIMGVAKKPVTVKTRAGYNDKLITAVDVAKICEKYGVSAITIHGRTKAQGYLGKADLDIIRKVKDSVSIPVIGNGDVVDIKSAYEMFEKTGVDAIMVGRAAFGNPWIFKSIVSGEEYIPTLAERKNCILEHFNLAVKRDTERVAVPTFRKHIAWYLKGLKNNSYIRDKINKMTVAKDVEEIIINYFWELENE